MKMQKDPFLILLVISLPVYMIRLKPVQSFIWMRVPNGSNRAKIVTKRYDFVITK